MQIQISWLLQKPTDLDLHCFLRQDMSCSAKEGSTISSWIDFCTPENVGGIRVWWFCTLNLDQSGCSFLFACRRLGAYSLSLWCYIHTCVTKVHSCHVRNQSNMFMFTFKFFSSSIAVTTVLVLVSVKVFVKVFKRPYLLNFWIEVVHTYPDVRYWSEVLYAVPSQPAWVTLRLRSWT